MEHLVVIVTTVSSIQTRTQIFSQCILITLNGITVFLAIFSAFSLVPFLFWSYQPFEMVCKLLRPFCSFNKRLSAFGHIKFYFISVLFAPTHFTYCVRLTTVVNSKSFRISTSARDSRQIDGISEMQNWKCHTSWHMQRQQIRRDYAKC